MEERITNELKGLIPAVSDVEPLRLETVDRIGPDAAHRLIVEAVQVHLNEAQSEIWRRRRETMLRRIRVIENNLDYELRQRGLAA